MPSSLRDVVETVDRAGQEEGPQKRPQHLRVADVLPTEQFGGFVRHPKGFRALGGLMGFVLAFEMACRSFVRSFEVE